VKKAARAGAAAFLLCAAGGAQSATNLVSGLAYGTNYTALSTAPVIQSVESTNGSLVIAYEGTTNIVLAHDISGFIVLSNRTEGVRIDAAGAALSHPEIAVLFASQATNLSINGGRFTGLDDTGSGGPPGPGQGAVGGWIADSSASITDSEFTGAGFNAGMVTERSALTASNVIFRGGESGIGLFAFDNSSITIHSGSLTGGTSTTGFYLQNSDATVYDGTFAGNIDGTDNVAGTGLFSEMTQAATNSVTLYGGTFSSLAFFSTNGAVQHFLAGTNLTVQNGIVQNGGTVIVDNLGDSALSDIVVLSGDMMFPSNAFTLAAGGRFVLDGPDSSAHFSGLQVASNAALHVGTSLLTADAFTADSFSSNLLTITESTNGQIMAQTARLDTNSIMVVDAAAAGLSSSETNDYVLISTAADQLFAGSSTNQPATAEDLKENVSIETTTSDRTRLIDLYLDTLNGRTLVKFSFTAKSLSDYWDLANGTSSVVTEEFADELDQLAGSDMLAIIDQINDPAQSLAAIEDTYFTTMNTFQTALYGMQAAVGQAAARGAEFREQIMLRPAGARGPQHKSSLRGWARYYGLRYDHDADGLNHAYESTMDGGVIGVDKSVGSLLLGLGGGWGRYTTTSGKDAEENINAYHGALYGTYGFNKAYIDGGLAYGFNEVETRTASPFVLDGEFDAQMISGYLGGGIDLIDSREGMVFTPEASIQYTLYEQEAYTETGAVSLPRQFDDFDADSLRSSLGLNISVQEAIKMETFSFKYDVRLHWIREYNPEPGNMGFGLAGGQNGYELAYPLLDENVYRAGVGAVFFNSMRGQPRNVMFRIDFDELFGDGFNSHNFSAKVIYAF
jgi:hypothetical protein